MQDNSGRNPIQEPWYLQQVNNIPLGEPVNDPKDINQYYKNPYGGKLPIGSLRLQKREKRKRRLRYVTKSMFFGGALGLIVITAVRFTIVDNQTAHDTIMNFYYFFFGVVMALSQLNIHKIQDQFRILNYYWGKGIFCIFVGSLSTADSNDKNEDEFMQWTLAAYFLVVAILMFILAIMDRQRDVEQAAIDTKIIQATYVEDDYEGGIAFELIPFQNWWKERRDRRQREQLYGVQIPIQNDERQNPNTRLNQQQPEQHYGGVNQNNDANNSWQNSKDSDPYPNRFEKSSAQYSQNRYKPVTRVDGPYRSRYAQDPRQISKEKHMNDALNSSF